MQAPKVWISALTRIWEDRLNGFYELELYPVSVIWSSVAPGSLMSCVFGSGKHNGGVAGPLPPVMTGGIGIERSTGRITVYRLPNQRHPYRAAF